MVFGSLIAGSTPVGGGVVAFPLVVLYLKLPADQGRDLSLLVQAIGMSAASFLLIYAKRHLCHFWIILWFLISSLAAQFGQFILLIFGGHVVDQTNNIRHRDGLAPPSSSSARQVL